MLGSSQGLGWQVNFRFRFQAKISKEKLGFETTMCNNYVAWNFHLYENSLHESLLTLLSCLKNFFNLCFEFVVLVKYFLSCETRSCFVLFVFLFFSLLASLHNVFYIYFLFPPFSFLLFFFLFNFVPMFVETSLFESFLGLLQFHCCFTFAFSPTLLLCLCSSFASMQFLCFSLLHLYYGFTHAFVPTSFLHHSSNLVPMFTTPPSPCSSTFQT